jgi:hypothetical protein
MNDRQLSPHFSLFQLTRTDHADLQEENRNVTQEEELKLGHLANLLEVARGKLGCDLDIHSGRRFLLLNQRVGSGPRSQHLKCEAVDFSPQGPDSEESVTAAWQRLATAAREGGIKFGQLILEGQGQGREHKKWWVHLSLGAPFRAKERCGEVLTIIDGKTTLISTVS